KIARLGRKDMVVMDKALGPPAQAVGDVQLAERSSATTDGQIGGACEFAVSHLHSSRLVRRQRCTVSAGVEEKATVSNEKRRLVSTNESVTAFLSLGTFGTTEMQPFEHQRSVGPEQIPARFQT